MRPKSREALLEEIEAVRKALASLSESIEPKIPTFKDQVVETLVAHLELIGRLVGIAEHDIQLIHDLRQRVAQLEEQVSDLRSSD